MKETIHIKAQQNGATPPHRRRAEAHDDWQDGPGCSPRPQPTVGLSPRCRSDGILDDLNIYPPEERFSRRHSPLETSPSPHLKHFVCSLHLHHSNSKILHVTDVCFTKTAYPALPSPGREKVDITGSYGALRLAVVFRAGPLNCLSFDEDTLPFPENQVSECRPAGFVEATNLAIENSAFDAQMFGNPRSQLREFPEDVSISCHEFPLPVLDVRERAETIHLQFIDEFIGVERFRTA